MLKSLVTIIVFFFIVRVQDDLGDDSLFMKSLTLFRKDSTLEMLYDNCENASSLKARVSQAVKHESQREKRLAWWKEIMV